jgi:Arc/MetJ-type ribon-helix-helix transcriptional regulator
VTVEVPVLLTEEEVAAVDALVESGRFANRSDVLRTAFSELLRRMRKQEIGELGLAHFDAWSRSEGGAPL